MSGGKKLAEMLSERLGYRCVSREIITKSANDFGVPVDKLFEAVKKSPSFFQKLSLERDRYIAYIRASLCEYAKDDNLIYHGNAGHFLLQGVSHILNIRLVADMSYRAKAAMEQLKVSEKEALKYIEQVDKERIKWTEFLYDKDWSSPDLYDIVFNLSSENLEFVCEMVSHAVKQPPFISTPESREAMQNLLTASRVRAALAGIPNIRLDNVRVEAVGANIVLQGRVKTKKLLDAILKIAGSEKGIEEIDNQLEVDYRSYSVD